MPLLILLVILLLKHSFHFFHLQANLMFSILNTLICLAIGYPLAYLLANKKYNRNAVLVMLFVTPMWINFVLRTWATRDVLTWIGISGGTYPYLATMIGLR